jgi:hypothetical protein
MTNTKKSNSALTSDQSGQLLKTLKGRFEKNMNRHKGLDWTNIEAKLKSNPEKLWVLHEMERTGGEPDVIDLDRESNEYIFYDCTPESPKGRRSLCYDRDALEARKKYKPENNVMDVAAEMGVELLTKEQYLQLQKHGPFDTKTSSWLKTPADIREHGGAIFGDYRYGEVFIYHNGADSYYASRGFRGLLRV